ncbi:hypothetical protein EI42_05287 [Thermosporothrix hazakensis]|jgi:hypothetical protein|uniref:Uncharacterized protein n=2 Tax=Thermosporothrix TaxID=768650 RepID=A0A326TZE3_THEHA|nr:hypothetical protein [Thermosporothrix hazakensis]PZW22836.1 hypothetical protein EI42_05287 [Thermosporothrix hazakensis]BBH91661.1 hypothetical protein KTC_64120 [Thermosporothrix sp. COM3]GCE49803.1 hypothetical protein KTH_46720 [Thermosporothrix hazakensis]
MSWQIINELLILASVDAEFYQELIQCGAVAALRRGFQLTEEEQAAFENLQVKDVYELSRVVIERIGYKK